ncbi:MAG: hypothetical protein V4692_12860 [Bdellovibrionota bacterium]
MSVEAYRGALTELESDRVRVLRDKQAYSFAGMIVSALAALAFIGFAVNPGVIFGLICLALASFALVCFNSAAKTDGSYQRKFSSMFTRNWIHEVFPEIYFTNSSQTPIALDPQILGIMNSVLRTSPSRYRGFEKLMFEKDPHHTTVFVLEKRSWKGLALLNRSTLVWFMPLTSEKPAFVRVTKSPMSRPMVEESGAVQASTVQKMLDAHATAMKMVGSHPVTLAKTDSGMWLAVDDVKTPFRAPVSASCFDVKAYEKWMSDAKLPFSNELRQLLAIIR